MDAPGEETKEESIGEIVELDQSGPGDFFEMIIEREAGLGGDGSTEKTPRENSHEIARQQPKDDIRQGHSSEEEERPNHEFGSRGMLAGIHPPELPRSF